MYLTIAIPTYNRNRILNQTVRVILSQLEDDCQLVIIDNCSDTPVTDTLPAEVRGDARVHIKRNPVNIGGNANILRCFELDDCEWLWVIGDDDLLTKNALRVVKDATRASHAHFLNFTATNYSRKDGRTTTGLREAIVGIDNFPNLLFVSTGVYRVEKMKSAVKYGYQFCYSCAPHLATMLMSLGEDGLVDWRKDAIIERPEHDEEAVHNLAPVFLGIPALIELPMPEDVRSQLMARLSTYLPSLAGLLTFCVIQGLDAADRAYSQWLFRYTARRLAQLNGSIFRLCFVELLAISLHWPSLTLAMLKLIGKLCGRKITYRYLTRSFSRL